MTDLFPHYPSPPEELVGIAAQLISTAADAEATISDVRGGVDRAVDAVDGDLTFPMSTAPEPVIHTGANLTLTARFASGAVMFFAQAVHTYNQGIDRLNAQVHEGELDAMSAGKAAKLQRLTAEQAQLEADLDAAAARVATMLQRGPNAEDMRFLRSNGFILPLDLVDSRVLRTAMAGLPAGNDPEAMRRWWDSLSLAQQVAGMAAHPEQLGNTDGLPAELRDEANRLVLADDLARLQDKERDGTLTRLERDALGNIRQAISNLDARESHIDPVTGEHTDAQLYIYQPYAFDGDGRLAIATGNLDSADHVAVMVPGMGSNVQGMLAGRSLNVYDESRWASGDSVAVLDWVGYDAPSGSNLHNHDIVGVVNQRMARAGAEQLAADVED